MESNSNGRRRIAEKLAVIVGEMGLIACKGYNKHFEYPYFTDSQTMAETRQRLSAASLTFSTSIVEADTEFVLRKTRDGEKSVNLSTVKTMHWFTDGETGEVSEPFYSYGMGEDTNDKSIAKAITSAVKYALLKNFLITDEPMADPDAARALEEAQAEKSGKSVKKHNPTKEESKAKGSPTVQADLTTLRSFLKAAGIPEEHAMACARKGKMSTSETTLDDLKPGSLARLLSLRQKIGTSWLEKQEKAPKTETAERGEPRDVESNATGSANAKGGSREPIQTKIHPKDVLEKANKPNWREVAIHFGTKKGETLGELEEASKLAWWITDWKPKPFKNKISPDDLILDSALYVASHELGI